METLEFLDALVLPVHLSISPNGFRGDQGSTECLPIEVPGGATFFERALG